MEFKFETQLGNTVKVEIGESSTKPDARKVIMDGAKDRVELTVSGYELFSLGVAIMEHIKEL